MYWQKLLKYTFIFFLAFANHVSFAQKQTLNQFTTELLLNGTLSEKWATEFYFNGTRSSTLNNSNLFHEPIQTSFIGWANYYYSPRWKFGGGMGFYDNKNAPDIGQFDAPEWRFSLQGIYYFHKIGYTLSTRSRFELRNIKDINNSFEQVFRFRQQIKYLKPIGSQALRQGVFYAFASDEIYLKSNAHVTGITFFDKNSFNIGGGYLISEDLQIELSYLNDYQPRDAVKKITNNITLQISYNNLLKKVRKKIKEITKPQIEEDSLQ